MPGKKFARRRKKGGGVVNKVGKWAKVGATTAGIAYTALKTAQIARGLINAEFKWVDGTFAIDATTPFDSGSPIIIDTTLNMVQGVGANQFIGQSVRLKSWYMRLRCAPSQNASANPWSILRVIFLMDKNMDGSNPTITEILQQNNYLSPLSMSMPSRYKIFHDKSYTVSKTGQQAISVKVFKRLSHHFKVNAANPTQDRAGRMFLVLLTDSPNPYGPFVDGYYRYRYIDN